MGRYLFERAQTVAVCKECAEDIWPGDEVLIIDEREPGNGRQRREIYCKSCGELYIESQELGQPDA